MKNVLSIAQNTALIVGSLLLMFSFVMGANADSQPIRENWLLVMGFAELLVIYSIVSVYINRNK
jgi:uncharacterized membrane protein